MKLTKQNYFSLEADRSYMSNSQYKGFLDCEAKQMAILNEKYKKPEPSTAMQVGSYVHAWNENKLDEFKKENPSIFKKDGTLKAEFRTADRVIETISNDELFMYALSGKKEVMMTANLFGVEWKILVDSYFEDEKRFGDLKVLRSLYEKFWDVDSSSYQNVFEYRGYLTQMAIYAEVIRFNKKSDEYFEPFLAVVTKEEQPDKEIISFVSDVETVGDFVYKELAIVENNMKRIKLVKDNKEYPKRCQKCDYCKSTKVLKGTKHYSNFELY
jgi:hypothetical protein